ncbi:hypothetical protein F5X99DRAFT_374644 [Biscogniauxia marginata]|nr:hypothetical protein F5X99DRAFT_374644 [Biscogniauxia marginata]
MDLTDTSDPLQNLEAAKQTAIAELAPDLPEPVTRAVRGLVTITWPYNSVKNTFAFILAEPDFRLRRNKGQVRVNFSGAAAKVAGESGLGSNDEVLLSLEGVEWEAEEVKKRQTLPGAGIDWQLRFSDKILLSVKSGETGETKLVTIQNAPPSESEHHVEQHVEPLPAETAQVDSPPHLNFLALTPAKPAPVAKLTDGEFESPAFLKRARMSYGSLFEGGFDIFEDDGGARGRGRKRSRFGRDSGAWRYTSQSPSPEPAISSHSDVASQDEEAPSSPIRPRTADEGCQTMELDVPVPLPVSASTNSPKAPETEDLRGDQVPEGDSIVHPQEDIVDHDIQANPHNGWTPAPPEAIPSFVDSGIIPDTSGNDNTLQSNHQMGSMGNSFGHTWDSTPAGLMPENYVKASLEPQHPVDMFPSDSPGFSTDQTVPFNAPRLRSHTHSPNRLDGPDDFSAMPVGHETDQEPLGDEGGHTIQPVGPTVNYPPLSDTHEVEAQPIQDEALTDYPTSYLEDNQQPSQDVHMEPSPFNQGFQAVTSTVPSLWATVNTPSQATALPPTGRLDSAEGSTPDQAVMIDESDSDDDLAPAPTAVEDTLVDGHADVLDIYEDADIEDDVDAQYSDDDEPEYDADEMGGDYDTRNYAGPNDDEDDSHDEDLQEHELEPEFGDEESYDEDEDEENLEYESEYEMDFEEPQQAPRHVAQSNPTVIDLISSDEDEGEDEDDNYASVPAAPSRPVPDDLPQHQQQARPNNLPQQSHSYVPASEISEDKSNHLLITSDAEESYEDEGESVSEEDEEMPIQVVVEDENDEDDDEDDEDGEAEEDREDEEEEGGEFSSDEGSELDPEEFEETDDVRISMNQQIAQHQQSPKLDLPNNSTAPRDDNDATIDAEEDGNEDDTMQLDEKRDDVPLSAADGLEILSQAVENESNGQNHVDSAGVVDHTIIDITLPETKETPVVDVQTLGRENRESMEGISGEVGEEAVGTEPPSKVNTELQAPVNYDNIVVAPSSPPTTQKFLPRTADDLMEDVVQNTTPVPEAQRLADQLPTPRDTQLTDMTSSIEPLGNSTIEMDVSQGTKSVELNDGKAEEVTILTEQLVSTNEHSTLNVIDASHPDDQFEPRSDQIKHQPPEIELGRGLEPVDSLTSSPNLKPQTQVENVDTIQAESFEETPNPVTEVNIQVYEYIEVGESGMSLSFQSQMEGDEELQASILENSLEGIEFPELPEIHVSPDDQLRDQSQIYSDGTGFETAVDEMDTEQPETGDENVEYSSPVLGKTPMKQPAASSSSPLQPDALENHMDIPDDTTDTSSQIDPSIQLARAANASKRSARRREATPDMTRPSTRSSNTHESPAPEVEDSSIRLARASSTKTVKTEEDSSMSATKLNLVRHLRDELPDCTSLKVLRQHLTKTLDVIAVAMMKPPEPRRGKSGPREYMMSFTITDHSIGPHSVAEVQLYRPHKDSLPQVKPGDVILLRNFKVMSLSNKGFGLRTTDGSSWAVFDHEDEPAQIKGPPVEYGEKETTYVAHLREWFGLLDEKARTKLEQANQKVIGKSRSK